MTKFNRIKQISAGFGLAALSGLNLAAPVSLPAGTAGRILTQSGSTRFSMVWGDIGNNSIITTSNSSMSTVGGLIIGGSSIWTVPVIKSGLF